MSHGCSCCSTEKMESYCPICKASGQLVKSITVKNMVVKELLEQIEEKDFFICPNSKCGVIYFNEDGTIVHQKEVTVPVWFKEGANPKYACYCNKVTEEEIIDSVNLKGAKTMRDVMDLTGAMQNGKCLTKNPAGQCCHKVVQSIIEKTLGQL